MPYPRSLRTRAWALLLGALTLPSCYSPERGDRVGNDDDDDDGSGGGAAEGVTTTPGGDETAGEDPTCTELEETCATNGDCPCFDGSTEVGAGLCLASDGIGSCTAVCEVDSDCRSGCCVPLEGVDFQACGPASACEGGDTGGSPSEECIDGVALFCACAAVAGVPCSEDEVASFAGTCGEPGHELYSLFECWGDHASGGTEACADALDDCPIE